jgi:hypothetical protein
MNQKFILLIVFIISIVYNSNAQLTQDEGFIPGTICKDLDCSNVDHSASKIQNGNGSIATSYTVSGCGLNFVTVTVRLNKRSFSTTPATGVSQPASINVAGLPACFSSTTVARAYLYCGGSGNGIATTATIKNTANVTTNFPMTIIGNHIDKCWGYTGTYNYRADVTSAISGNGSYTISGLPTNPPTVGNDMDGATLFIVFRDPTQTYTGHFVIADGCAVAQGGTIVQTISGFNVCGATNSTQNFMIISDLQQISATPFQLNSTVSNYTFPAASNNVWDYILQPGAAAASGQTSATYGLTNTSDCYNVVVAGMYYRTACLACVSSPCVPLPIELLTFDSECEDEAIRINWETSTERNNKSFQLLRSENGKDFELVASIAGAKNSTIKKAYTYLDTYVREGHSYYYKLTDIDNNDNEKEAGQMIYAECKNRNAVLEISPNPSQNEMFLVSENDLNNVNIRITDGLGSEIKSFHNVTLLKGEKFQINLSEVNNGYYHLSVVGVKTVIQKKILIYK